MKNSRNVPAMQLKVGALLAVAGIVLLLALIFPTKGVNPFSAKSVLTAYFPQVAGLRVSSPVWFSGMEVGSVTYVDFVPGARPPRLKVVMRVERRILEYLRADSRAAIKGMGLLGDMYIDLTPGGENAAAVESGAVLVGVPPAQTGEEIGKLVASAGTLLENLSRISDEIAAGRGTLGRLVQDPALYTELRASAESMRRILETLDRSEGTAGKVLNDPALYEELLATVRDLHQVVNDLKQAETALITPATRETLTQTVSTVNRVAKRVGEVQEKIDQIKFDLNFGADKYSGDLAAGHADLLIWPNRQRYYTAGLQKASRLYGHETDQTTFQAQLAWRLFDSPVFIRGGLMRSEYFVAGLDLRPHDDFKVLLDAYRIEFNPFQLDVRAGYTFFNLLEVSAGAEDVLRAPFYKAGLIIHYRDDDLINVLFKMKF